MHLFRVWAPRANSVAIEIEGLQLPLEKEPATAQSPETGWWQIRVPEARHGTDYAYVLDGQAPAVPDPRSSWQPKGVHGPSRVYDHSLFAWSDQSFQARPLPSAVIYELHIGTFTAGGTFDAAIARLDYLVHLGITHVELMPVASFPGSRGWGYDGVDLFAPQESYGGPDGLKRLVDACHQRGLAVLLDVVYNHLGPSGNYLGRFGPYFTSVHHTPWGDAVNLEDAGSYEVRRFFCDNAVMWLRDYHFDGLRLDAVHAYIDRSAISFMEQLGEEVDELEAALGRHLVVIAESDANDPRFVTPREAGGFGLDAQWSDDFHHALVAALTGDRRGYYADFGSLADLADALRNAFVYGGRYSAFRDRRHGRSPEGLPGWRFLGYSQNHDQVGNTPRGDRLHQLVGMQRARVAAAIVLCAPFVPMLFEGEEFATSSPFAYFTDHEDPELARAVSEGRRSEFAAFGWSPEEIADPQAESSFRNSVLKWGESEHGAHARTLAWYRALIDLRRRTPELTSGRLDQVRVSYDEAARWIAVKRSAIYLVANLGKAELNMRMNSAELILGSESGVVLASGRLTLPADSVAICRLI